MVKIIMYVKLWGKKEWLCLILAVILGERPQPHDFWGTAKRFDPPDAVKGIYFDSKRFNVFTIKTNRKQEV